MTQRTPRIWPLALATAALVAACMMAPTLPAQTPIATHVGHVIRPHYSIIADTVLGVAPGTIVPRRCGIGRIILRLWDVNLATRDSVIASTDSHATTVKAPCATEVVVPPPAAVASINVNVAQAVVTAGQTTQASAIARDSAGNVLANRVTTWGTSAPSVASISSTGLVSALTAGTSNIIATVEQKTGTVAFTVAPPVVIPPPDTTPPPPPSPGHPHEPAGFTQLSPTLSGDSVPLTTSGPLGWIQRNMAEITQVIDSAVPYPSKKVLNINFPSGMIGGGSPGIVYTYQLPNNPQNWPQHPSQVYESFWYKVSPNFPANLTANKLAHVLNPVSEAVAMMKASADYKLANGAVVFAPGAATQYDAALFPIIAIQGNSGLDGSPNGSIVLNPNVGVSGGPETYPSNFQIVRGRWHHIELLVAANTAGHYDAVAKLWLDGVLVVDYTNRLSFGSGATPPVWQWTTWYPIYGGGGSIPNDGVGGYHRLKDFYVSGSSVASSQRIQVKKP